MKIGPSALIAAQLYGSTSPAREAAQTRPAQRPPAKFEIADEAALRGGEAPASARKTAAVPDGAGRREAPMERPDLKRPGSLVDLTA